MAQAPRRLSIADVLGFGSAPQRNLTQGYRQAVNRPATGTIKPDRKTFSRKIGEAITPNTRAGNEYANKIASLLDMITMTGAEEPLVQARGAAGRGDYGQAAGLGILAALGAIPGAGKVGGKVAREAASMFDTVRDAGMGQVFRRTPEGAYVTVMENSKYAPRPNSVTDFVVPEELRGKGIGGKMLDEIFSIYGPDTISAAASSVPSVKAFYKRGLRPGGNPNATLDDALKIMREDSSVTMVAPKQNNVKIKLSDIEHGESAMPGGKLTWPGARGLIADYAMRDTPFPPIEVIKNDPGDAFPYMIYDGSHRYEAAKLRGNDTIDAIIVGE